MNADVYPTNTGKHLLVPAGRPIDGLPAEIQSTVKPPSAKTVKLLTDTPLIGINEAAAVAALSRDGYYVASATLEWHESTTGR